MHVMLTKYTKMKPCEFHSELNHRVGVVNVHIHSKLL